ncbi:nuclear receptor subfamily 1 group D member 2 [Biomphalaria glabrata]|nr:nuclear receptor subfamily 1 group D member 2-like [Biomphalaria glabrata]
MIKNNATSQPHLPHHPRRHFHETMKGNGVYVDRRTTLSDHLDVFVSNQLIPYDNPSPHPVDHAQEGVYQHEVLADNDHCPASNLPQLPNLSAQEDQETDASPNGGTSSSWYNAVSSLISSPSHYHSPGGESVYSRANSDPYGSHADRSFSYAEVSVHDIKNPDSLKQYKTSQSNSVFVEDHRELTNGFSLISRSVSEPYDDTRRNSETFETNSVVYSNGRQHTLTLEVSNNNRNEPERYLRETSLESPGYNADLIKYEDDSDYSDPNGEQSADKQFSGTCAQKNSKHKNFDLSKSRLGGRRSASVSSVASIQGYDTDEMKQKQAANDHGFSEDDTSQSASEKGAGDKTDKSKCQKQSRGAQNLPPCRVCGNKASGLHFGVNTCEACNEFFRRSLKRGASYYCTKNRECQVYGKKRNACSYCRYRRCVEMGMSRDAIKTGRYSHKTRTEYAMEVEEFKQKEVNKAEKEKFEVFLKDLVMYHDKYVKNTTRVPSEELYKNQSEYLHLYNTQRDLEMRHPPLSTPIMNKKLLTDFSPEREDLSLTMHDVEMTEKWLRNYINYAKNVPGFKELALSDQASLVRGTWFEFWFLGAYRGYNSDLRVVYYPNGRTFHEEEIIKVFGKEYTDFSFSLADRMASLRVTPEEMVLIKTVCLTFPDRTPLQDRDAVESMHWQMVSCLLHTLEKNRPGDSTVFPMVVNKLVELRTLTDIAMRAHKSAIYQDVLKESPLLSEMVDTKTIYINADAQGKTVSRMPVSPSPL